ncbi:hypothetical protein T492DRAFT_889743 [Pavlovales sp. CCMP2436]|nr:hypothetical protein T492DRAFT_889743 [Pavlovales sp. CCMP2436]
MEHDAFQAAMRMNKQIMVAEKAGISISSLPVVLTSLDNDTRVECPTCGRRFSEVAAERHIPKCGDIRAKPKMLKAGAGGMSSSIRKGAGSTGRW